MELTLGSGLRELPGIGEARASRLEKLGLATVEDLLRYFPRDYEDRRQRYTIAAAPVELPVCVAAMVAEPPRRSYIRKGLELTKARVVDARGSMELTFFNQSYVKNALVPGESYIFYGMVEGLPPRRRMTNPVFEPEDRPRFTGRIMPIYPLTAGISNNLLSGLALRCVQDCAQAMPEILPFRVRQAHALAACGYSYQNIHFPASEEALALARRRLIFEELFYLSCGLAFLRSRREGASGPVFRRERLEPFFDLLPFSLTEAQRRAIREAAEDCASGRPMNRLVQGDVGSGKTMVAAACCFLAWKSGWQAALMAPTEILAEQHFRTLSGVLAPAGLRVGLLTGSMRASEKKKVRAALAAGEIDLLVGTHAILSAGVDFAWLGLVITDEQHRFGVGQRSALAAKGGGLSPHVLVMSATPIPRTLALIIYGDLDVSVIDELPPGRTPVETFLVGEDKRARMYQFVRRQVAEGRQVYIVCPAVEEAQPSPEGVEPPPGFADLKAVTAYAKDLQEGVFPDLRVGFVHGRLKPREKEAAMAAFAGGALDVLVSTTVIEVGVDVPNASLIIVENADRFGLSQLHQLRGRVGRGKHQSYCVLITSNRNQETRARLKVLTQTTDGFRISEEDLKLRGPGDFFGKRQHGLPQMRIADLAGDTRLLKEAQEAAQALLAEDPTLDRPEHQPLKEQIRRLFTEHADIFN
ncbi:MAG: ATP-dependent DNA helicase RecG [Clostridiales bacterium]|nr:ATP-dependent DNA helicase RecG [Clostridiales bacterium]